AGASHASLPRLGLRGLRRAGGGPAHHRQQGLHGAGPVRSLRVPGLPDAGAFDAGQPPAITLLAVGQRDRFGAAYPRRGRRRLRGVSVRQNRVLDAFSALPLKERLFVRARLFSAPLGAIAERCPVGRILDVGCGHGALIALLAGEPGRTVLGIDPDSRKIAWAKAGPGRPAHVSLRQATGDDLRPELEGHFDAVAVADVLYLLPTEAWGNFAECCRRLLKSGGLLLLKEAEANGSWKHFKCLAQEQVMVRLLRRTRGSGGLTLQPRRFIEQLLKQRGFAVEEVIDLSAGYTTPHMLYVARA